MFYCVNTYIFVDDTFHLHGCEAAKGPIDTISRTDIIQSTDLSDMMDLNYKLS